MIKITMKLAAKSEIAAIANQVVLFSLIITVSLP